MDTHEDLTSAEQRYLERAGEAKQRGLTLEQYYRSSGLGLPRFGGRVVLLSVIYSFLGPPLGFSGCKPKCSLPARRAGRSSEAATGQILVQLAKRRLRIKPVERRSHGEPWCRYP
jgi:hypothetical protein